MATNYQQTLFVRLAPTTAWTGSRITDTDLLTLSEAASMASVHAGTAVSANDFLRAASRGEIMLRAIVRNDVTMSPCRDSDVELQMPAGSIANLPLTACRAMANVGTATWNHLDGFERSDSSSEELWRFKRWKSKDGAEITTVDQDCRVIGYDVHALADAFRGERKPTQPPDSTDEELEDRRSDPVYMAKYHRAWELHDELDKWKSMKHGGDPLRAIAIEQRLAVINAELAALGFSNEVSNNLQTAFGDATALTSKTKADSELSSLSPAERRDRLDITRERGARRRIIEGWSDIEKEYGAKPDGTQVLRVLKRDKDEKQPSLKTVQNLLSLLRSEGLIP